MLEIYIDSVIRLATLERRDDIEEKLRLRIEKLLGGSQEEATIIKIIDYLGEPQVLVLEYQSDEYLIGPKLYVAYKKILAILFRVLLILFGVSNLIAILIVSLVSFDFFALIAQIGQTIPQLISIGLYTIAIITLIFSFIEKNMKQTTKVVIDSVAAFEFKILYLQLTKMFSARSNIRGHFIKSIAWIRIVTGIITLLLLYFLPKIFIYSASGTAIPIFNKEALSQHNLLLVVAFGSYILLNVCKLFYLKWTGKFLLGQVFVSAIMVFFFITVISDPQVVNTGFLTMIDIKIIDTVYTLNDIWPEIKRLVILFTIILGIIPCITSALSLALIYKKN
ncbi:MAG: hypothetical protein ACRC6X_04170 [Culicoidibacterales bacterium]